jgi:hypothetical protein
MAAAPESGSSPHQLPRLVLAVVPVSVTHPRSMTSRPLPASGPLAPIFAPGSRPLAGLNGALPGAAQVAAVQALCAERLPLMTRYWGR